MSLATTDDGFVPVERLYTVVEYKYEQSTKKFYFLMIFEYKNFLSLLNSRVVVVVVVDVVVVIVPKSHSFLEEKNSLFLVQLTRN